MSRAGIGDTVSVKATNNVYTVLALIGTLVAAIGVAALFLRANELFGSTWMNP